MQMEVGAPPNVDSGPRHRSLTTWRICRGIGCLVVILSTAFMLIVYWAPVTAMLIRLFSTHYSRMATSTIFGMWLSMWPYLFEKINRTKVVFSGDMVPMKERVLLIANHRTEVDWMYLWDYALRKGCHGYIKYVLKSSLMKLPIFGWAFHILEFIPLERCWEVDKSVFLSRLSTFKDSNDPLWLAVFPEGTDYTEKKCIKSQQYAAENGLPILKNVLLPKIKGFNICVQELRSSLDAVYDITIAYKFRLPNFLDNVFGVDPSAVHIHVKRIPVCDIPTSEDAAGDWLIERFRMKDQLLSDFAAEGHFPDEGTEGELSSTFGLLNFLIVVTLTAVFVYITIFGSFWYKLYVAFSCLYLTVITYFGFQIPQLFRPGGETPHEKRL